MSCKFSKFVLFFVLDYCQKTALNVDIIIKFPEQAKTRVGALKFAIQLSPLLNYFHSSCCVNANRRRNEFWLKNLDKRPWNGVMEKLDSQAQKKTCSLQSSVILLKGSGHMVITKSNGTHNIQTYIQ